jgi:hypothetical protein
MRSDRAPWIVTALAVLIPASVSCDSSQEDARDSADRELRPYQALVEEQRGAPLADRVAAYLPLTQSLSTAGKTRTAEEALSTLLREIVLAGDFAVLEALERECSERGRKQVFWTTVSRSAPSAEGRKLLARWAEARPEEILLAGYRPGGIEFLLEKLEDATLDPRERADCARELSYAADASVIPRMIVLVDDRTPVSGRSVRAGGPLPTLGGIVRSCIERLERTGDRNARR